MVAVQRCGDFAVGLVNAALAMVNGTVATTGVKPTKRSSSPNPDGPNRGAPTVPAGQSV